MEMQATDQTTTQKTKAQLARESFDPNQSTFSLKPKKKELKMFLFKINTRQYNPNNGRMIADLKRHPFKSVFEAYKFVEKIKEVESKEIQILHNPLPYLLGVKDVAKYNEAVKVYELVTGQKWN